MEQPSPSTVEQDKPSGNRSLGLRAFLGRALSTEPVQATLLASSFLILKVLLVAKGDILAGLAVLQSSPTVTVITGAIKWSDVNFAFPQLRRLSGHTPWPPP
jgi:hypothetical protein